jgi:hypothetical protein
MAANPSYRFDEPSGLHVWAYDDTTVLKVSPGRPDGRGRLMAAVLALAGETILNRARMDMLSQDDRAKFHANTLARMADLNGDLPVEAAKRASWFARLVDVIPMVETAPEPPSATMTLTPLGDLLAEADTTVEWIVDDRLPAGGIGILTAKPKVGKSTLARQLALAVARGEPFLGRSTAKGAVIYLALEEKRSEVRKHFLAMGATKEDEIYIFASTAPADALAQIRAIIEDQRPALLIIDPLFRFMRVRDSNDYAQVTQALEPIVALARETGAHVLCVHHEGKGDRPGGDAILGSTAIFGAVDTALSMKRTERYRTISSVQRYGNDLEETTLRFDPATRITTLGETREREEELRIGEGILAFLETKKTPVTEAEIDEEVEGRRAIRKRALRQLVKEERVSRLGRGGKGDPYRYGMPGTSGQEGREPESNDRNPPSTGDADHEDVQVPWFPPIYREPEYQHSKAEVTPQEDEANSGSRDDGNDGDGPTATQDGGNQDRPTFKPDQCSRDETGDRWPFPRR